MQNSDVRPVEVSLINHGETDKRISGQHTGSTDIRLFDNGEAAARLLGPVLADRVHNSVWCNNKLLDVLLLSLEWLQALRRASTWIFLLRL